MVTENGKTLTSAQMCAENNKLYEKGMKPMKKRTHNSHKGIPEKILSLFLSLCLLACALPSGYAEDSSSSRIDADIGAAAEEQDDRVPREVDFSDVFSSGRPTPDSRTDYSGTYYINNEFGYRFVYITGSNNAASVNCGQYNMSHPSTNTMDEWDIEKDSDSWYTISLSEYPEYKLGASESGATWQYITGSVPVSCLWNIGTRTVDGVDYFYLFNSRERQLLNAYGTNYSYVDTVEVDDATETALWRLMTPSSYHPLSSISVQNEWLPIADTISYADLHMTGSVYNYSGYPTFYNDFDSLLLTSSNTSAVRISNSAHTLTAVNFGTATITVQCRDCTTSCTFLLEVTNQEGTYYLRNVGSGGYMEPYSSYVRTGTFSGNNSQRWVVQYRSGGYYSIKDVQTNGYLSILNNSTSANAQATTVSAYTGASGQQFKFARSNAGYLTIKPKCGENNGYVLGVSFVSGGYYAGQGSPSTSNNYGKWRFNEILPLSGYEQSYNPNIWNSNSIITQYTNCYSYAINTQTNPAYDFLFPMQPNQSVRDLTYFNNNIVQYQSYIHSLLTTSSLVNSIQNDAEAYGFGFVSVGRKTTCPSGTYKVALVLDPSRDYHWYRQNSDGTWSHKTGQLPVCNVDASGELIFDPALADRNYSSIGGANYTTFIGYYYIIPLNNILTSYGSTLGEENFNNMSLPEIDTYSKYTTEISPLSANVLLCRPLFLETPPINQSNQ